MDFTPFNNCVGAVECCEYLRRANTSRCAERPAAQESSEIRKQAPSLSHLDHVGMCAETCNTGVTNQPPEPTAAACGSPHRRGAAPSRWCRSLMMRSASAPTRPIAIDQLCLNDKRACRRSASQLTLSMHAPTHCPKCAVLRGDGKRAGSERQASQ